MSQNIDFDRLKYSLTGEYEEVMLEKQLKEKDKEIERLNNIINKALEKSKGLQYRFGYILDDLVYILMQGSDSDVKD